MSVLSLCLRFAVWDQVVDLRLRRGDLLGVARVMLAQRRHAHAARVLNDLICARAARLRGEALPTPVSLDILPQASVALTAAADQPVHGDAFRLLATAVLAISERADVKALQLEGLEAVAEEAGTPNKLKSLKITVWLMGGLLPATTPDEMATRQPRQTAEQVRNTCPPPCMVSARGILFPARS